MNILAAASCPSDVNWLDHLSAGGAIAVAAIALACGAVGVAFVWSLFH